MAYHVLDKFTIFPHMFRAERFGNRIMAGRVYLVGNAGF
jgi:hypothetical protein